MQYFMLHYTPLSCNVKSRARQYFHIHLIIHVQFDRDNTNIACLVLFIIQQACDKLAVRERTTKIVANLPKMSARCIQLLIEVFNSLIPRQNFSVNTAKASSTNLPMFVWTRMICFYILQPTEATFIFHRYFFLLCTVMIVADTYTMRNDSNN